MRILVLDTLIQTVDFDEPVRGGLVKSAMLDVIALAEKHEVFYAYYGKATYDYKFTSIILDSIGSKDWCLREKKKVSLAHHKLTKDIPKMLTAIGDVKPDALIVHVCSKSRYLDEIAKKFADTPKVFVFHDGVSNDDLFGTVGILGTINKLKKFNSFITTNSKYTRDSISKVMINREKDIEKFYPELRKELGDVNTYQLFDKVYKYFVYYDNNAKLDIVDNAGFSVNIGRYQKKKGVLDLLQLHKYNNHVVKLYGVQDPVFDPGLKDYNKIKEAENCCEGNYIVCEGFTDEELREDAKHGNNLVISCPVEGFGFTAFEMGVFGMPCVILKHGERHATEEYLKHIGAEYVVVNKQGNKKWKEELYEAMLMTKLSTKDKEKNAQKFLDYFTLENYIHEREKFIKLAKEKIQNNRTKTLF